ncbi:MAG: hypothetical protein ACM34O_07330, partial [Ignavibacteria bacterium]
MTYKIFLYLFFIFLSLEFYLFAQDSVSYEATDAEFIIVDSIFIVGTDVTEDEIILRELTFSIGDTVSNKQLLYNQDRIY